MVYWFFFFFFRGPVELAVESSPASYLVVAGFQDPPPSLFHGKIRFTVGIKIVFFLFLYPHKLPAIVCTFRLEEGSRFFPLSKTGGSVLFLVRFSLSRTFGLGFFPNTLFMLFSWACLQTPPHSLGFFFGVFHPSVPGGLFFNVLFARSPLAVYNFVKNSAPPGDSFFPSCNDLLFQLKMGLQRI